MYKEVAINPECMGHEEYYFLLKRETGYEKGRYLVADMRVWAREAFYYAKESDMSPVKKKSVTNFLNKLAKNRSNEHFAMPGDRSGLSADCWLDWWLAQCSLREFSVTLSEDHREGTICHMEVIDGSDDWEIGPSLMLRRDSVAIVDALELLLNMSKELLIVDQYFSFSSNKTLIEMCGRLERCSSLTSVHLVTAVKTADPGEVYAREYASLMPEGVSLRVTHVPDKYFHDRYMITDIGALKAGYGFKEGADQGAPSDILSVNLMSLEEVEFIRVSLKDAYEKKKAVDIFSNN
ncbi:hypothetical protein DWB85_12470 [Seongchinamella sediminis]|uniref:Uncharacterized protein n=1 Tax=Seongchinamella sediminis TaxID=2283635 RepID=A0A3L7DZK7_9GAMM|nr:hypothetical protein [Seongchinamella sediminis]RLQ21563.1 hypothetical protein DWB85_12470 [Seongchinamella sediminis]